MHPRPLFVRSLLASIILVALHPVPVLAAPHTLSMVPEGVASKPAPNVIVSVDDSAVTQPSGFATLKNALAAAFADAQVPDGSIRLAWQAVHRCRELPSEACSRLNAIKPLDSTHRQNFLTWLKSLEPSGNRAAHPMLHEAGDYLRRPLDKDSAWAAVPGKTLEPVLACRRAYDVVVMGGPWNTLERSPRYADVDSDSTRTVLPDGQTYDPASSKLRIYGGRHSGALSGVQTQTTLSDLAFRYWSDDLQPGIENKVEPRIKAIGDQTFGNGKKAQSIPEYWNPRNDPATWQHLSIHAVGFGRAATQTDLDETQLITGDANWPNPIASPQDAERVTDLRHAAINARGKFIRAPDEASLADALKDIFGEILSDQTVPSISLATSSYTTRLDSALYVASYDTAAWSGSVTGYKLGAGTAKVAAEGLWGNLPAMLATPHSTATLMDARPETWPAARVVLSANTSLATSFAPGISWDWANLSTLQKKAMKTVGGTIDTGPAADALAERRMLYLRGDRSNEQGATPPGPFRTRRSRLGDIVHSRLWHLPGKPSSAYTQEDYAGFRNGLSARASMLYVGANDGMLHGFDASTGQEKIAYIPEGLHAALAELTNPAYRHRYFVDGSPLSGDLYLGVPGSKDRTKWRTYLAGFPGAGGRGYFVIDATDPDAFSAANARALVVLDRTAAPGMDIDVGHILSEPVMEASDPSISRQITRLNNGRWALVTGNGYNSESEKAVLLIQYLDQGMELFKIAADATGGNGNGLSAPRLIDLNGDRVPDVAYAGDLRGNLWKFDLSGTSPTAWKVAFSGAPFYVAKEGDTAGAARQPITTAPVWKAHPEGGLMIAFGTGRNLTDADRVDPQQQTIYGIYDKTPVTRSGTLDEAGSSGKVTLAAAPPAGEGRASLVAQTVSAQSTATADSGARLWTTSSHAVDYTGSAARRGWFIDLPNPRERVLQNLSWFKGDLIDVPSRVPTAGPGEAAETCDPSTISPKDYRTTIDILNGARPKTQIYGYGASFKVAGEEPGRIERAPGIELQPTQGESTRCVAGPGARCDGRNAPGKTTLRPSWRQFQ